MPFNDALKSALDDPELMKTEGAAEALSALLEHEEKDIAEEIYAHRAFWNKLAGFKENNIAEEKNLENFFDLNGARQLRELAAEKRVLFQFNYFTNEQLGELAEGTDALLEKEVNTKAWKGDNLLTATAKENIKDEAAKCVSEHQKNAQKQQAFSSLLSTVKNLEDISLLDKLTKVGADTDLKKLLSDPALNFSKENTEALGKVTSKELIGIIALAQVKHKLLTEPSIVFLHALLLQENFPERLKEQLSLPEQIKAEDFDEYFAIEANRTPIQEAAILGYMLHEFIRYTHEEGTRNVDGLDSLDEGEIEHTLGTLGLSIDNPSIDLKALDLGRFIKVHNFLHALADKDDKVKNVNELNLDNFSSAEQKTIRSFVAAQFFRTATLDKAHLEAITTAETEANFNSALTKIGLTNLDWTANSKMRDEIRTEAILRLIIAKIPTVAPGRDERVALIEVIKQLSFKAQQELLANRHALKLLATLTDENELKKILNDDTIVVTTLIKENAHHTINDADYNKDSAESYLKDFLKAIGGDESHSRFILNQNTFKTLLVEGSEPKILKEITPAIFKEAKRLHDEDNLKADQNALKTPEKYKEILKTFQDAYKKQKDAFNKFKKDRKGLAEQFDRINNLKEMDFINPAFNAYAKKNATKIEAQFLELANINEDSLIFLQDYKKLLQKQLDSLPPEGTSFFSTTHQKEIDSYRQELEKELRDVDGVNTYLENEKKINEKFKGVSASASVTPRSDFETKGILKVIQEAKDETQRAVFKFNASSQLIPSADIEKRLQANSPGTPLAKPGVSVEVNGRDEDEKTEIFKLAEAIPEGQACLYTLPYQVNDTQALNLSYTEERFGEKILTGNTQPKVKMTMGAFPSSKDKVGPADTDILGDADKKAKAYFATAMMTQLLSSMHGLPTKENPVIIRGYQNDDEKVAYLWTALRFLGVEKDAILVKGNSGFSPSSQTGKLWGYNKESHYTNHFESNAELKAMADNFKKISEVPKELAQSEKDSKQIAKSTTLKELLEESKKESQKEIEPEPPRLGR